MKIIYAKTGKENEEQLINSNNRGEYYIKDRNHDQYDLNVVPLCKINTKLYKSDKKIIEQLKSVNSKIVCPANGEGIRNIYLESVKAYKRIASFYIRGEDVIVSEYDDKVGLKYSGLYKLFLAKMKDKPSEYFNIESRVYKLEDVIFALNEIASIKKLSFVPSNQILKFKYGQTVEFFNKGDYMEVEYR